MESSPTKPLTARRWQILRCFLWLSVFGWGVGLGAKLFDLLVVAGAWAASPPASFALLPYGPRYPIDPGNFFQPLSALMVLGIVGALVSGWRVSGPLRFWLWVALGSFLVIWAVTPTLFWPMIGQLWGIYRGRITATDAEAVALARRWIVSDWCRVGLIALGFVATVRAISLPIATRDQPEAFLDRG